VIGDADVLAAVEARLDVLRAAVRFVHEHPELGHEEHECAAFLCDTLAAGGLAVERGVAGLQTAFRASFRAGRAGRSVGIVCLFDAVPTVRADGRVEPVHSCGHGPIAGGVTAAALALADLRDDLAGKVVVVGCPADEIHTPLGAERGGGKALTAEAGLWDALDAALYAHPEFIDTVSLASRWMRRDRATVFGARSLTGAQQAPLDSAAAAIELARAQLDDRVMLERLVLDGDVEEGTGLALRATFLLFADDEAGVERQAAALREALPGASWEHGGIVAGVRPDARVTAAVADAFRAAGRSFVADPPALPFATDFGNVSRRVPSALVGVGREGGWSFHTDEGAAQFASEAGEEAAVAIARVLALAAVRLTEPTPQCGLS
jgi:metal-dependent amidase/aminoacylase/carboxypeptidase family protein